MIPLVAMMMIVIVGVAAFAVDFGNVFLHKRRLASATDLATLAGAQKLPNGSQATADARTFVTNNWNQHDASIPVTTQAVTSCSNGASPCAQPDRLTVSTDVKVPLAFAKVFHINTGSVHLTATATMRSFTSFGANVMPWAILSSELSTASRYTTPFTLKAGGGNKFAPGDFGPVDLPKWTGSTCSLAGGASDYRDLISGVLPHCEIKAGDVLQTEPGSMTGPTQQGLSARTVNGQHVIQNLNPSTVTTTDADGSYVLKTINHPNVILIPTINAWPGGSGNVTVQGLTWFLITSYSGSNVTGLLMKSAIAPADTSCHRSTGTGPCTSGPPSSASGYAYAGRQTRFIGLTN